MGDEPLEIVLPSNGRAMSHHPRSVWSYGLNDEVFSKTTDPKWRTRFYPNTKRVAFLLNDFRCKGCDTSPCGEQRVALSFADDGGTCKIEAEFCWGEFTFKCDDVSYDHVNNTHSGTLTNPDFDQFVLMFIVRPELAFPKKAGTEPE